MAFRTVCGVLLLALAGDLATAGAAVITIQPSNQDAFIEQDSPNQIFGAGPTNTRIRVQSSPSVPGVWRGFVQFDLSAIPQFSSITSATLGIYESIAVSPARTHAIHVVTQPWLQSGVKWNNQPAFVVGSTATFATGVKGFKLLGVTPDVQAWVNAPTSNHGWIVKDNAETTPPPTSKVQVPYHAKEENAGLELVNRPKLIVDFTGPPCSTNAQCADTNPCTVNERCDAGHCAVDPLDCDDGLNCTDDICDPSSGCLHPSICNDGFDCTIDNCNEATSACSYVYVDSACTNGGCKVATCVADPFDPAVDPITGCVTTSVNPDGTSCNDAFCQLGKTCLAGNCQGGSPRDCSDTTTCTTDTCNEATDQCVHTPVGNGTTCDDGLFCTTPGTTTCLTGVCQGGTALDCADTNQCTVDSCSESTDQCLHNAAAANGTTCDDGLFCTTPGTSTCAAGACQGGTALNCADTNACTADSCNEATDQCVNDPAPLNGTTCDDGLFCTTPGTSTCAAGACQGGTALNCADTNQCTVDSCNEGTDQCDHNAGAANGVACDDGLFCTVGGTTTCLAGACQGGTPVDCSGAGDTCHDGVCNEATDQCVPQEKPDGTGCADGDPCTSGETCTDGVCGGGSPNPSGCVDHYQCYKAKAVVPFIPVLGVTMTDAFETGAFDVRKVKHVCNPADKNGEGIIDQTLHEGSYQIKRTATTPKHIRQTNKLVVNQLGQLRLDTTRPDLLLVPASKSLSAPPAPPDLLAHPVDHYKCYKIKVTRGTPKFPKGVTVTMADQFTSPAKTLSLKKPRHLCLPVSANGSTVNAPNVSLVCYLSRPARGQPKHVKRSPVYTNGPLGALTLKTIREDELCIPSERP